VTIRREAIGLQRLFRRAVEDLSFDQFLITQLNARLSQFISVVERIRVIDIPGLNKVAGIAN